MGNDSIIIVVWIVAIVSVVGVASLIEWFFVERAERHDREVARKRQSPEA